VFFFCSEHQPLQAEKDAINALDLINNDAANVFGHFFCSPQIKIALNRVSSLFA
jgi:hypothetical protein